MPELLAAFDSSGMNPAQARAVRHPGGPALVLAGPGSGKTFLIVNRIRYLTECCQAAPESILVITFTRAAARSMERRFTDAVGGRTLPVTFATFHAIFYHILRTYGSYSADSLITEKEKRWYLRQIMRRMPDKGANREKGFPQEEQEYLRRLIDLFGIYKNNPGEHMEDFLSDMSAEEFKGLFAAYESSVRRDGKLDFDDMAGLCLELFRRNPRILQKLHRQYRYILIDEYQDTNAVQDEAVRMLAYPENEIFAVGDDDQAIYGFRGSAPDIMRKFEERYPGAQRYLLETNYRSTGNIVDASVKMIAQNQKRFVKKLSADAECGAPVRYLAFSDKNGEYEYLAARIKELSVGIACEDMAVITRTNRELERIAGMLRESGIPCSAAETGKSRFRHFIVRDVMDCLAYAAGETEAVPAVWRKMEGDERKRQILSRQLPYAALQYLRRGLGYDEYLHRKAAEHSKFPEEWEEILQLLTDQSRKYSGCMEWKKAMEEQISEWEGRGGKKTETAEGVHLLTMHGAKGL
ncbi:MAG: ATP-dependent helicase, partial [Lachnospiraceae bacterium]|nr:ATP-dependent helicase [Lachnospiraceae bacterium]